jgi:hypothetical protein
MSKSTADTSRDWLGRKRTSVLAWWFESRAQLVARRPSWINRTSLAVR